MGRSSGLLVRLSALLITAPILRSKSKLSTGLFSNCLSFCSGPSSVLIDRTSGSSFPEGFFNEFVHCAGLDGESHQLKFAVSFSIATVGYVIRNQRLSRIVSG